MTPIRKFFYYLAGFVAFISLVQLPFAFAVSSVFSTPDNIDTALEEGGVYDNVVPLILEEASKQNNDATSQQIMADPGLKNAITSSVKSDDIQAASQSAIDGIFAWLQGKTDQPEFTIDLSKPANQAVEKLTMYAQQRAAGLPACTLQQLQTVDFQSDVLSIPCLPPGVSAAQIGQQFSDHAKQQIEILRDPVIDSKQLIREGDAGQLQESQLPEFYQSLHSSKWFTLTLVIFLISLLVFARRDRLAGIRYVAILLLTAAGVLGIALLMALFAQKNIPVTDDKIAELVAKTLLNLTNQIISIVRWFVLGYAVIGIATLVAVRKFGHHGPTHPITTPNSPDSPAITS